MRRSGEPRRIERFDPVTVASRGAQPFPLLGAAAPKLPRTSRGLDATAAQNLRDLKGASVVSCAMVRPLQPQGTMVTLPSSQPPGSTLVRVGRLALAGALAGTVGHELTNVVAALQLLVEGLRRRQQAGLPPEPADVDALAQTLARAVGQAAVLTTLAHPQPSAPEETDLRDVVRCAIGFVQASGQARYFDLELRLSELPVRVLCHRAQLEQVILELIENAVESFAGVAERPRRVRVLVCVGAVGRVRCIVEDNGRGIPAGELDRVFTMYYTTKAGEGTGLGLPVARRIVESHGGWLKLRSTEGEGTTAVIDLPLASDLRE